jgi:hypothetical protein
MRWAAVCWRAHKCPAHLTTAIWWRDLGTDARLRMRCWALRWRVSRKLRHLRRAIEIRDATVDHGTKT